LFILVGVCVTLQESINLVLQHQQAGRLEEAQSLCRAIVADHPEQAGVWHLLGLLSYQLRRYGQAAEFLTRAIAIQPNNAESHSNLGVVLLASGDAAASAVACRRALALQPNYAEAMANLGNALAHLRQFDDAIGAYRRALALRPAFPEALNNLGNALKARGQAPEATAAYRRAIALHPQYADAHFNLGTVLLDAGDITGAIDSFERALEFRPDYREALLYLATAFDRAGRCSDLIETYRRAIALRPDDAEALTFLGKALREAGRIDEAIPSLRRAIELHPDNADAHLNLAYALLAGGQWPEGWREYEWRQRLVADQSHGDIAVWRGEDLGGQRILVRAEQGFGDVIQFSRYLPLVAARGGRVVFECYPELRRLLSPMPGVEQFIVEPEQAVDVELQIPLLSLPMVFGTTPDSVPSDVPYVRADPELTSRWHARFAQDERRLKVGIVWAGSRTHRMDRERSIPPRELAVLAGATNVRWVSLQKRDAIASSSDHPPLELSDWTEQLHDFADTAALLANLDLLVTIDSAPAHLAGAMGRPVWVLLSTACDFRWMLGRDDSPWYPSMRLLRQSRRGDWAELLARVAQLLKNFKT
jgi:tetratricopeptide (TPR) repeat protein